MKCEDDDKDDDENVKVKYFHNKSSKICLRFTQDKIKTSHLLFQKLKRKKQKEKILQREKNKGICVAMGGLKDEERKKNDCDDDYFYYYEIVKKADADDMM